MGFLTDIVTDVRARLATAPLDLEALERACVTAPPSRDWVLALAEAPTLIAEVKRASPSVGAIASPDPVVQAGAYVAGGAAVVSVLTEASHFGGSLDDLRNVRAAVPVPVLRKDFLVSTVQVVEARAAGADAVLVITSAVDDGTLTALLAEAAARGVGVLLETHSDEDLERALGTDAVVIGVNARDLESLEVNVPAALARIRRVPPDRISVFESGVRTAADVAAAVDAGASAILVGETLMRAADPAAKVRELLGKTGEES